MEFGLNKQARQSKYRTLALVFFLGVFVGVVIGHALGSDGRTITIDDLLNDPVAPSTP